VNATQPTSAPPDQDRHLARLETRLGNRLAGALTASLADLSPEVRSRLRFAREQALQRHAVPAVLGVGAGGTVLFGRLAPWWPRLGALLPLAVLVAGALAVAEHRQREAVAVATQIDGALLVDELPPQAYADPGFVAFLKLRQP
jgi:hypothetical protein